MSIDEQNDAFIQSLEADLMKEIAKIDEACKSEKEDKKPTLEELRQLRTQYLSKNFFHNSISKHVIKSEF